MQAEELLDDVKHPTHLRENDALVAMFPSLNEDSLQLLQLPALPLHRGLVRKIAPTLTQAEAEAHIQFHGIQT